MRERRIGGGYAAQLFGAKPRPRPQVWKWPTLWAFLLAFTVQMFAGILPTFLSFAALVATDENRCPVALGAKPIRPFLAWLLGAIVGIVVCESVSTGRNAANDWVFWGSFAALFRYCLLYTSPSPRDS